MSVNWRDYFNIGIPEIDSQHRELFSRLDKLEVALKDGKGREIIIKTFHFLDQYVHVHFNAEEQLQSFYNYPHQAMHVTEHNTFKKRLSELEARLASEDPSEKLAAHTHAFLTQWLISHVTGLDKELAGYIKEAQAKQWRQWQKNQF